MSDPKRIGARAFVVPNGEQGSTIRESGASETATTETHAPPLRPRWYSRAPLAPKPAAHNNFRKWLDVAAEALLPYAPPSATTTLAEVVQIPSLRFLPSPQPSTSLDPLGVDVEHGIREIGRQLLNVSASSTAELLEQVGMVLGRGYGGPGLRLDVSQIENFVARHAVAIERATIEAFKARWRNDAAWMGALMRAHPKLSVEELRRAHGSGRGHVTPLYAGALPHQLDDAGALTQVRHEFWPSREVDRLGPEPNYLLAAQLAYQLLEAPSGATTESVLASWQRTWFPFWNHNECLEQRFEDSTTIDSECVAALRRAYPFIPEWPEGRRPNDAPTLERLRRLEANEEGDDTFFRATTIYSRLEDLQKIPLYDEEYFWYAVSRSPREVGALQGLVQVETEHAINDKFAAKRFEILVDGAAGSDIWQIIKNYSANDAVIDVLQRCLGIQIQRAERGDIETLTKRCIEDRLSEGRPILLHIQGVQTWGWIAERAALHHDVPLFGVSHTTSDMREWAAGGFSVDSTLIVNMAGSTAKIVHERDMFSRSFVYHVSNALHDLDLDVRGHRFVVIGYGEIIGRAMWNALEALPHTRDGNLVVFDPHLDPAQRRLAEARGVTFIDDLEVELGRDQPHVLVECVGKKQVVTERHFDAMKASAVLFSFSTGNDAFAVDHLAATSRDDAGRPLRVAEGRIGNLPSYRYMLNREGRPINVTLVAQGSVANFAKGRSNITKESVLNNILVIDSKRQAVLEYNFDRRGVRQHEAIVFDADGGHRYPSRWDPLRFDSLDPEAYYGLNPLNDVMLELHHPQLDPERVFDPDDPLARLLRALENGGYDAEVHARVLEKKRRMKHAPPLTAPVEVNGASRMEASSWSQLVDLLELRAHAGQLQAVFFDVDNVLVRPRGYLGSERDEWDQVHHGKPREVVLAARDRDEARMVEHQFIETPGALSDSLRARLLALKTDHGVRFFGWTARPEKIREETLAMLRAATPIVLDDVLFTSRDKPKAVTLCEALTRLGLDAVKTVAVDDLDVNLDAAAALGTTAVKLRPTNVNYEQWTHTRFLKRALLAPLEGERFELLLNAARVGSTVAQVLHVRALGDRLLGPANAARFQAELARLMETHPLASLWKPL